ncbi:restriction endonuclease subunit S [Mammaliicoccus sciuri]|uniref:restriction endonuclease subunit S n=1 Tax=Mammaliicoccus sciuri TaxID=1296 RepID=UPI001E2C83A0|nr:restriction endonuclease subunit S [Mammaliicoccus sciuri]MCD8881417.1 restriction endonuclease subunit S [Mammaliicoccus sciuri]MDT0708701.1 restriction endonuclease subunit S [Mammaliicoccus sciuri]MDT0744963.1 restriction endonuclease subunit S [Mammaliicoccus sciuri]MDT0752732.1 restriction endonuclease subunit S [Mammaliicoccus sciuri]MEB7783476.1 restriction endonuclease subunit S [Mammaliicoccus sciuri]
MTNEVKKVPELRFPEFDGEWEEKKLNQIVKFSKGKLLGKKDLDESGKNYCILYGELYTKYGFFINQVKSKTNVNIEKLVKGENNQVLLPSSGETAEDIATASSLNVKGDVYIGGDLNILTPINKDGNFISLSMNGINKWKIAKLAQGKTVVHLYNENLKTLNLNIPVSREEQEKIGEFFSKLDRQIELEEQKLAKLEEQKKGYMQKIFSQELRFKDENGNEYPEWSKEKLENIADFQNGKAHESIVSIEGKYILVNSKFISSNSQVKKHVSQQLTPLNKGEIAIVMSDVPKGKALAKCFLIDEDKKYSLNQRIGRIYNISGNSRFLYAILNRNNQLLKYDNGVGQTNLKKGEITDILINWPISEEQEKIGKFLNYLDKLIKKESNKVESLKKRKQGLLQKMFI